MVSCPARDNVRSATLKSLSESDWAQAPIVCFEDPHWKVPLHRHMHLVRAALEAARGSDGELFLFLEDDIVFNRHLRSNLESWEPIRRFGQTDHLFASVFNPGVPVRNLDRSGRWIETEPSMAFGAQGLVISRRTVEHLVSCWGVDRSTHADLRLARLAGLVCAILYHRPSLIQHVGVDSLWGGIHIAASDFDRDWLAAD
jgi:hypothetical protein